MRWGKNNNKKIWEGREERDGQKKEEEEGGGKGFSTAGGGGFAGGRVCWEKIMVEPNSLERTVRFVGQTAGSTIQF